ncbi:MAG: dehydrogenase, partial [Firmicutes bacterium]|nr:dehydrogenase [Bacillota bacterium]
NFIAQELGLWQNWAKTYVRGATVLGNFDPNTLVMWINKNYCKNGYAYLVPFDSRKASIVLVVTDIVEKEVNYFWEECLYTENIKYTIIDEYTLEHRSGYIYPHKTDNIYFAGNAGGGMDSLLGFALVSGIIMGGMAGRSIATGQDYEKLIEFVVKRNRRTYEIRKSFNKLGNKDYDIILSVLGLPGIKHLIYDTHTNVLKLAAGVIRLANKKRLFKE